MISLFKNIMDVQRVTIKADSNGEAIKEWETISSGNKCSLSKKSVKTKSDDPAVKTEVSYILFAPYDVDILQGDRVIIDGELSFLCQQPHKYKLLKKQEIEVDLWR